MSFKRIIDKKIIESAAVVADESVVLDMRFLDNYACQIDWTSTTASATIKLQESNDNVTFTDISGKSQAISNNSGNVMLSGSDFGAKYLKVLVDYSSGTITTVDIHFFAKSK